MRGLRQPARRWGSASGRCRKRSRPCRAEQIAIFRLLAVAVDTTVGHIATRARLTRRTGFEVAGAASFGTCTTHTRLQRVRHRQGTTGNTPFLDCHKIERAVQKDKLADCVG